jgi:heat shock protein HtpX
MSTSVLTTPAHLVDVIYAADRSLCWVARRCGFAWQPLDHDKKHKPQPARKVASGLRVVLGCTVMPLIGVLRVVLVLFIFAFALAVIPAVLLLSAPAVLGLTRLSRYREYAADRTAAMLTAQPMVLAATLTSLDEDGAKIPKRDLRELRAVSSMTIIPLPVDNNHRGGKKVDIVERILASHPPVEKRVERIAELTRGLAQ